MAPVPLERGLFFWNASEVSIQPPGCFGVFVPSHKTTASEPRGEAKRPPRGGGSGVAKAKLWQLARHVIATAFCGSLVGQNHRWLRELKGPLHIGPTLFISLEVRALVLAFWEVARETSEPKFGPLPKYTRNMPAARKSLVTQSSP